MEKKHLGTTRGSLLYILRTDRAANTIVQLHESNCPDDTVAWFSKSRTGHGNHVMDAAYLAIKPEMAEARDMIVLSCLLAEHKLRVVDVISDDRVKVVTYLMIF